MKFNVDKLLDVRNFGNVGWTATKSFTLFLGSCWHTRLTVRPKLRQPTNLKLEEKEVFYTLHILHLRWYQTKIWNLHSCRSCFCTCLNVVERLERLTLLPMSVSISTDRVTKKYSNSSLMTNDNFGIYTRILSNAQSQSTRFAKNNREPTQARKDVIHHFIFLW